MFNKREKKNKKSNLNLDSIKDTDDNDQNKHNEESQLTKRPEPYTIKKASNLQGQSETLTEIYKSTIINTELLSQATSNEEIQAQLKKLKDQNTAYYQTIDNDKRENAKVYAKEHINSTTGKIENQNMVQVNDPQKIKKSQISSKFGPVRQMRNIQHSNGIDYNKSRCKDYFESGYCAFGNSCIFIHDRSDYKSGYDLDLEWDEKNKKKDERRKIRSKKEQNREELEPEDLSSEDEGLEDYEDELVYKEIDEQCLICGLDYKMPSLLPCGHIFCDKCAVEHYQSAKTCFKCKKVTGGIFNDGSKLLKKAREEREKFKNRIKVKKSRFGFGSSYLMDVSSKDPNIMFRANAEEDDNAIIVPKEAIDAAMNRIKQI